MKGWKEDFDKEKQEVENDKAEIGMFKDRLLRRRRSWRRKRKILRRARSFWKGSPCDSEEISEGRSCVASSCTTRRQHHCQQLFRPWRRRSRLLHNFGGDGSGPPQEVGWQEDERRRLNVNSRRKKHQIVIISCDRYHREFTMIAEFVHFNFQNEIAIHCST